MKKIHLIGNAHLDPVWLWKKEEGLSEVLATFRSALDRMKEFPDYIFTCGCASYYRWVEQVDPAMLDEIRERVKEGRWSIVGGYWIQPDCNMPSGESFARQALYSQRYFKDTFGVMATAGYHPDSFGHNGMLPQLLKQSGMDAYLYMRPCDWENPGLKPYLFRWESPDGSAVTAYRLPQPYNDYFNNSAKGLEDVHGEGALDCKLEDMPRIADIQDVPHMCFYGVGNHGGGPTIRALHGIEEKRAQDPRLQYSSVPQFFEDARINGGDIPVVTGDLQHHAIGCYSAGANVKLVNCQTETALVTAERCNMLSYMLTGKATPQEKLTAGWKKLMFNQFHDILAGCTIRSAVEPAIMEMHAAADAATETTNLALQQISWRIGTTRILEEDSPCQKMGLFWEKGGEGAPMVVFNPHSFAVTTPVMLNIEAGCVVDDTGVSLPVQSVRGEQTNGTDRDKTIFMAKIPPLGYATYYAFQKERYTPGVHQAPCIASEWKLENAHLLVEFDPKTGCICRMIDKKTGRNLIGKGLAARAAILDDAKTDTWGHGEFRFDNTIGYFDMTEMRVLENGPLRATIRVESRYGDSRLRQDFSLTADADQVEVHALLHYAEKLKIMRLLFDANVQDPTALYSMPYGFLKKPCDGQEEPSHRFMGVFGQQDDMGLAILNRGKYSFSVKDTVAGMIVARSAIFADHYGVRDDLVEYMDQGEQQFDYALKLFSAADVAETVRSAAVFNRPPLLVPETHHKGDLPTSTSAISIDAENVLLETMKFAEDGDGVLLRLYETAGKAVDAQITLPFMNAQFTVSFRPQEIVSLVVSPDGGTISRTNFVEYERKPI
ncbi:MAG: alpha-mannosidase [Clostridia bacterium]|nr:alpha-mannosidase [Clostridia bacterium]